jgi:anti-sigma regulatory factor (Ser/Thr protein kinase)
MSGDAPSSISGYRHDALLYRGADDFVHQIADFVHDGLVADEPTMVAVGADKITMLRDALGAESHQVEFVDMEKLGHNPARIIPGWRRFLDQHGGTGTAIRGVGEPIWPGRNAAELVECQRHEALLGVAVDPATAFTLMCPYDVDALPPEVISEAIRSHPAPNAVHAGPGSNASLETLATAFLDAPLPEPTVSFQELEFTALHLYAVRELVRETARSATLSIDRTDDLVLAVNELATNSVVHAGGVGTFRTWIETDRVVCEVRDEGHLVEPLVGRVEPALDEIGNRGIWMVNQLCDLVQIRDFPSGTVVRAHVQKR